MVVRTVFGERHSGQAGSVCASSWWWSAKKYRNDSSIEAATTSLTVANIQGMFAGTNASCSVNDALRRCTTIPGSLAFAISRGRHSRVCIMEDRRVVLTRTRQFIVADDWPIGVALPAAPHAQDRFTLDGRFQLDSGAGAAVWTLFRDTKGDPTIRTHKSSCFYCFLRSGVCGSS